MKKTTIVYIHGSLGNQDEFKEIADLNKKHFNNIHILCPIAPNDTSFDDYIQILYKHILKVVNNSPCNLVGFSMGGRLAFYLKYRYPLFFKKISVISSQIISFEKNNERIVQDRMRLSKVEDNIDFEQWKINFFKFPIYGNFLKHQAARKKLEQVKFEEIERYRFYFSHLSVSAQPEIAPEVLSWVDKMLFICGEQDQKYKSLLQTYKKIFPESKYVEVEKSAHANHIENPIKVADLLYDFFK